MLTDGDATFMEYGDLINKGGLLTSPLTYTLYEHTPAFYAHMLGRPSKNLPTREVVNFGDMQTVRDFVDYQSDKDGYTTAYTEKRSGNIVIFGRDPRVRDTQFEIKYLD